MSMNITTKAGTHARIKEMEDILFSDFHKDVYGFRPNNAQWNSWIEMSASAFNEALGQMMDKMIEDERIREEREAEALSEFKAELKCTMDALRCDWKKAMNFMMTSDCIEDHEVGYWLWQKNLSFSKQNEIERLYLGA